MTALYDEWRFEITFKNIKKNPYIAIIRIYKSIGKCTTNKYYKL